MDLVKYYRALRKKEKFSFLNLKLIFIILTIISAVGILFFTEKYNSCVEQSQTILIERTGAIAHRTGYEVLWNLNKSNDEFKQNYD